MAKYGSAVYGTAKYGTDAPRWVFNRTPSDIVNNTERAYINYWDLNRIETRMKELSEMLSFYAYNQVIITKTDWEKQGTTKSILNIPSLEHLKRLHDNEEMLIKSFFIYKTTPMLPITFENLGIQDMNDIEKILFDLHKALQIMETGFQKSAIFKAGVRRILPIRR